MTADVAIIGAGMIGVYAAWRLAAAGATVVVFDQGIAGDGSTGRSAGGLRRQFASPYEITLSNASRPFYERLEADPAFPGGIDRTGYLFLAGTNELPLLEQAYLSQVAHGVAVDWLEPDELADLIPNCNLADTAAGSYTRDDGFIDPWSVHQWVLQQARSAGADVRQRTAVRSIRRDGTDWLVNTLPAHEVLLAAGAWTGRVAALIGIDLPIAPSPRVKVLTEPCPQFPHSMPLVIDLHTGAYVRSLHGRALIGAKPRRTVHAFEFDTSIDNLLDIVEPATRVFPSLANAGIERVLCGLYELTPDGLPHAGQIVTQPGLWVIAGFNGHGIMHGPAVVDAITTCMTGHVPTIDTAPLHPCRRSADRPRSTSLL